MYFFQLSKTLTDHNVRNIFNTLTPQPPLNPWHAEKLRVIVILVTIPKYRVRKLKLSEKLVK